MVSVTLWRIGTTFLKLIFFYLVGMFVFLHVLVLYVERSHEVWPPRNQ